VVWAAEKTRQLQMRVKAQEGLIKLARDKLLKAETHAVESGRELEQAIRQKEEAMQMLPGLKSKSAEPSSRQIPKHRFALASVKVLPEKPIDGGNQKVKNRHTIGHRST